MPRQAALAHFKVILSAEQQRAIFGMRNAPQGPSRGRVARPRRIKLEKVSDRLYHYEVKGGEEPLRWQKGLKSLNLQLYDVQAIEAFSVRSDVVGGNLESEVDQVEINRRIAAKGQFERNRELWLIDPEGDEPSRFDVAAVTIHPLANWGIGDTTNLEAKDGALLHQTGETLIWDDRTKPVLALEVSAPEAGFMPIWERLLAGETFARASLTVYVDVFQSEMQRALAEPHHYQELYIERESCNQAFFRYFSLASTPIIPEPKTAPE